MLHSIFKYCNYEKVCLCEWSQCDVDEKNIDIEHFWETTYTCIGLDVFSRGQTNEIFLDKTRTLYNPKSFVWTKCGDTYAFTIGLNPMNKFHVQTRLEHVDSNTYIDMNTEELERLFSILQRIFEVNISFPSEENNISGTIADRNVSPISIVEQRFKRYKIRVGYNYNTIHVSEHNLLKLLKQRLYFTTLVQQYEGERRTYEKNILQLLTLCCKHLNAIDFDQSGIKALNVSSILMTILKSPCSCVPQSLIIETATHFLRLLKIWIPIYRKTQLLSEIGRLETFKQYWPHKFIDGKELSKFGFYYIGPIDQVKCIFCDIILYKWTSTDEPLDEHLKYAPHCPLMNVNVACRNISQPSTDINKLLSKKRTETKDEDVIY